MNTRNHRIGIFCALLLLGALPVLIGAAPHDLPPRPPITRPTSTPVVVPNPKAFSGASGASIQLCLHFPDEGLSFSWQALWTTVQWQDAQGQWHDVEGWQGTLDEVQNGVGKKVWWVAEKDLGAGPFRWTVYRREGGEQLAESEPFYLPHAGRLQTSNSIENKASGTTEKNRVTESSSSAASNIYYLPNADCLIVEVELAP